MVRVEHALYSPDTHMAVADVDDPIPIEDSGEYFSFPLKYQYPTHGYWKEGGPILDFEEALQRILTYRVFSPNFVLAETRQPSRTIFLRDLGHPRYRLSAALPVVLEVDGAHVVAYSHDLDMFGWGDMENEALTDFKESICELYESLREGPANLGPHLQRVLRYLEQVIIEGP